MQMGNSIRARRRQHDETSGGLTRKATRQSECKSGRKTVTRKDRLEISRRKRRGRIGQEQAAESTGEELEKMGYEGKSGMKPCNKNMSTRRRRGRTDSFVHISVRVVTQETHMNNKAAEMTEINNAQPTLSSTSASASNSSMNSKRT